MLIVQVCDFGNDGDSVYRLRAPSQYLARMPGVTVVDCHFFNRRLQELVDLADVVVLQFVNDWDLLWLCSKRRAAGRVTVFEANDYFFDLQPWNMIVRQWQDPTTQELYRKLLANADGVQTSTDELARRWRKLGAREVAVFANQLTEVPPLPAAPDRPLTIGWGGSPGHLADWYAVAPVLQSWLDAHPEVQLVVMTGEPGRGFFRLPANRYYFQPFGPLEDYLQFLGRVDIGLAPLLETEYNRCRSDVKFLEYASRGVAGIYRDLEPYRGSVVPGETGLLYRTPGELIACLESLRTNPQLRLKLREQGHNHVATHRRLDDHIGDRLNWYESLVKKHRIGATPDKLTLVPSPLYSGEREQESPGICSAPPSAGSARPARDAAPQESYIQLPAQEPERLLLEAIAMPPAADGTRLLGPIIEQNPRYLPALQHYARLLNTRRDCRLALDHLERARALDPEHPRTLSEIGRTYFLLDDRKRAREVLERAIGVAPQYLPAWQYLLHLLGWVRASDGPAWSQRAEALFGACYPIALLGVRTYSPEEQAGVMLRVLERYGSTIAWAERPIAITAFRQTVLAVVKTAPRSDALALLRNACALFPESPQLAGELAATLLQQGFASEAFEQQVRALNLRRQAAIDRAEFNPDVPVPHEWQFAHHILNTREGNHDRPVTEHKPCA